MSKTVKAIAVSLVLSLGILSPLTASAAEVSKVDDLNITDIEVVKEPLLQVAPSKY